MTDLTKLATEVAEGLGAEIKDGALRGVVVLDGTGYDFKSVGTDILAFALAALEEMRGKDWWVRFWATPEGYEVYIARRVGNRWVPVEAPSAPTLPEAILTAIAAALSKEADRD